METVPKSEAELFAVLCYLVGLMTGAFVGVYSYRIGQRRTR